MQNDNPYQPPTAHSRPAFDETRLRLKAQAILKQQQDFPEGPSVGSYFRPLGKVLFFTAGYVLLIAAFCYLGRYEAAFAFGGFFVGRIVRDFQWVRSLGREWATTKEFIDWEKVRRLAGESPKETATSN
jgi:hypothetical protein